MRSCSRRSAGRWPTPSGTTPRPCGDRTAGRSVRSCAPPAGWPSWMPVSRPASPDRRRSGWWATTRLPAGAGCMAPPGWCTWRHPRTHGCRPRRCGCGAMWRSPPTPTSTGLSTRWPPATASRCAASGRSRPRSPASTGSPGSWWAARRGTWWWRSAAGSTIRTAAQPTAGCATGSSTCWRGPEWPARGALWATSRRLSPWARTAPPICWPSWAGPASWWRRSASRPSTGCWASWRPGTCCESMLSSWVPGADGSGFPAEHLPYGVVAPVGAEAAAARPAVRIGDHVLDLAGAAAAGVAGLDGPGPGVLDGPTLNPLLAAGPDAWRDVRSRVTEAVCDPVLRPAVEPHLRPVAGVEARLPVAVADYVDFYSSLEHATNLGRLFRPDAEPLLPNWRHLPVAY